MITRLRCALLFLCAVVVETASSAVAVPGAALAAPTAPANRLPVVEKIASTGACPFLLARVKLEARHGFVGQLDVHGCPETETPASDERTEQELKHPGKVVLHDMFGAAATSFALERGYVSAHVLDVYGDGRPVFVVENFDVPCMGSYNCGPRAAFFEIHDGGLRRLVATHPERGRHEPISLTSSLRIRWWSGPARGRKGLDLFVEAYTPDFNAPEKDGGGFTFAFTGTRYAFEDGAWTTHTGRLPEHHDGDRHPDRDFK